MWKICIWCIAYFFVSNQFLFCFVFRVTFSFYFFLDSFFLSSFSFSAKLKNCRDFLYPSFCNICRASLFSKIPHQNGTLVATEKPAMTHPYHTEPIVYLRIRVYHVVPPVDLDKCKKTSVCHYSFIQSSFIALKVLFAPLIHFPLHSSPWHPRVFFLNHLYSFSGQSYSWTHTICSLPHCLLSY